MEFWDAPEGPRGHELPAGTIRLYRQGTYEPELEVPAGEEVLLPPGDWVWVAEAPGFVSTYTSPLNVPADRPQRRRSFTVPVTPACRFELSEDRRWRGLDRLDVVSLSEAAVYPVLPAQRRGFWIPEGRFLAYGVERGGIAGLRGPGECRQGETLALPYPEPPAGERQALMVSVRLPETLDREHRDELRVELRDPRVRAQSPPVSPQAHIFQGDTATLFFPGIPAERPLRLTVEHPLLRSATELIDPLGGSVREIGLGALLERRELQVSVDYRPARPHDTAVLELYQCGPERSDEDPALLVGACGEPLRRQGLEVGFHTYRFPRLDDGQYLVSAVVDGEAVPGLGQRVTPYLEPGSRQAPVVVAQLAEMHVHGHLLRGDEPVPGRVHLRPWTRDMGIPSQSFATGDDLEYDLYYMARYPTADELVHFPEELRDEAPSELPGLYCCFKMTACGEGGACRTFNLHSAFTGEGRFDIPLHGGETVEVRAVDAVTGEPVPGARMLVWPSPAFHFIHGDVVWFEAAGMEPDGLDLGEGGRVTWLPPEPGEHRIVVRAPGYTTAKTTARVPAGGSTAVTVEMRPERYARGTELRFPDGAAVTNGFLLAFGDGGTSDAACHTPVDGEGFAAPREDCAERTFLLVHPQAALQVIDGRQLTGSASVEVRGRPPQPPRVRLVDGDGEPVRNGFVQLRLGEITLTPNDLLAAASAGLPFHAANRDGEIVLEGVDARGVFGVEVSPWRPYVERWVDLEDGRNGAVELVVEVPE